MTDKSGPKQCAKCGQAHARCTGHRRDGTPCQGWPMTDQAVCRMHGGSTPLARRAAKARGQEREAHAYVARLGRSRVVDPHEVLLEELHRTAGAVAMLDVQVEALTPSGIVWGLTREKDGGDDRGTTYEAGFNTWVKLWQHERKHLAEVAEKCIKVGVEERRVRVIEQQGQAFAGAQRAILDGLWAALSAVLTAHPDAMAVVQETWQAAVMEVVPRELRALAVGPATSTTNDDPAFVGRRKEHDQ